MGAKSPDDTGSDNWIETLINGYLSIGAVFVTDDQYNERIEVCSGCPHKGFVDLPLVQSVPGCTLCGCPLSTKPKVRSYFHPIELRKITVDCPDGRWPELAN